jgi:hypothetical protein
MLASRLLHVKQILPDKVIVILLFGFSLLVLAYLVNGVIEVSAKSVPSITIALIANTSPRWGIDEVGVIGVTEHAHSRDYQIDVDWGDGIQSLGIPITSSDGKWGPVYHVYTASASSSNPQKLTAFLRSTNNFIYEAGSLETSHNIHSETYAIEVQRHGSVISADRNIGPNILNKSDGFLSTTLVDKEDLNNGISKSLIQLVDATNGKRITAITNHSGKAVIPIQQYITNSNSMNNNNSPKNLQLKYAGDSMYEGSSILLNSDSLQVVSDNAIRNSNYIDTIQKPIYEFTKTFIIGLSMGAGVWLTMNGIARKYIRTSIHSDGFTNTEYS